MHAEFNSVVLSTVLYSRFKHCAKDVSTVSAQRTILELFTYPANLRRLAIFFFIRAVMVKSLYTLQLSSGYNDLFNSENLKVAIAQLCHDMQFHYVIADQKLCQ